MILVDSLDKVFSAYIHAVCLDSFTYKKKTYAPKALLVSPGILRGFTCPAGCGGCCRRFSLDYLPSEEVPVNGVIWEVRNIVVNGKAFEVVSDKQDDHSDRFCRNLNKENGRCVVHGKHPFSCDFELIRFFICPTQDRNRVNQQLYGRGWSYHRTDGGVGAKCEITPVDESTKKEVIRKLNRLEHWCNYFEIRSKVPQILEWAKGNNTDKPLLI